MAAYGLKFMTGIAVAANDRYTGSNAYHGMGMAE